MRSRWPLRASRRLYLRIYATVLAALVLSVLGIGLLWQLTTVARNDDDAVELIAQVVAELVPAAATASEQQAALARWSAQAQAELALFDAQGQRLAATNDALQLPARARGGWWRGTFALKLPDGRWLVAQRPRPGSLSRRSLRGLGMLLLVAAAIGVAAYPLVRRLTRGLERLQRSVEALGAGDLSARVAVQGHDEVAQLAASFNAAAQRIETLVRAQRTLLANASHELRSPLARIRMAVEAVVDRGAAEPAGQAAFAEAVRSIGELDALIDELLLASRLDTGETVPYPFETLDFTALVAEHCARFDAVLAAEPVSLVGSRTLLQRLLRNLLDNAQRHGGGGIEVRLLRLPLAHEGAASVVASGGTAAWRGDGRGAEVRLDAAATALGGAAAVPGSIRPATQQRQGPGQRPGPGPGPGPGQDGPAVPHAPAIAVEAAPGVREAVLLRVCDRGPGIAAEFSERIFEPFFRTPGMSEHSGGVGLGLSLVRQIAQRHGGSVRCVARQGGGSCFEVMLPGSEPDRRDPR